MPAAMSLKDVTESRVVAADTLSDLRTGFFLDTAFDRRSSNLDPRDRRWTQELVWGMLRSRGMIDHILTPRIKGGLARLDGDLADLLRLGVYQLISMGSVPPYAAIAQTVELAKQRHGIGASKLANAVLRRVDRERDILPPELPADTVESLSVQFSHPQWLVARWLERLGEAETRALLEANNREAPMVIRPWGIVQEQLEAMLESSDVSIEDVPLVRGSIQLGPGTVLTALGAFKQGHCFVQDPAATLVTMYAAIPEGARVADLCAAPGGKAIELARTAEHVTAADASDSRLNRLRETIERLEIKNITTVVSDAREGGIGSFDAVLIDVPCTGTGTFRRHPDARWRLRMSDIAVMAATQREILRAAAKSVAPGGLLIYSTCSIEPEENDAQIDSFLADNPAFELEPPPDGAVPNQVLDGGRLRVLPQKHGHDGSFAVRLRRNKVK